MSFISNCFNSIKNFATKAPETAVVPVKISLLDLPDEILVKIFQQVVKSATTVKDFIKSIKQISLACRSFSQICKDRFIYNEVAKKLFINKQISIHSDEEFKKVLSCGKACEKAKEFITKWEWKKEHGVLAQFLRSFDAAFFADYQELAQFDPEIRRSLEELSAQRNQEIAQYGSFTSYGYFTSFVCPSFFKKNFNPTNNNSDTEICENIIAYWKKYIQNKELGLVSQKH